jgi:hypothetical protein
MCIPGGWRIGWRNFGFGIHLFFFSLQAASRRSISIYMSPYRCMPFILCILIKIVALSLSQIVHIVVNDFGVSLKIADPDFVIG